MPKKVLQAMVVAAFSFFLLPQMALGADTCTPAGQSCAAAATDCSAGVDGSKTCNAGVCCNPAAAAGSVSFSNPLSFTTVQDATGAFLSALQGIIVTLALVFLVLGAVFYVISGGDEGRIKTAKAAITAAMIGLAIGIAAPSFLKEIYGILGAPAPAAVAGGVSIGTILQNVLSFLLSMAGILAIIMLVIGGLMYFAAAGDETRADTAKKIVKFSIIGIAVALASLVIVTQITNFF